jgi:hypothetical protein
MTSESCGFGATSISGRYQTWFSVAAFPSHIRESLRNGRSGPKWTIGGEDCGATLERKEKVAAVFLRPWKQASRPSILQRRLSPVLIEVKIVSRRVPDSRTSHYCFCIRDTVGHDGPVKHASQGFVAKIRWQDELLQWRASLREATRHTE